MGVTHLLDVAILPQQIPLQRRDVEDGLPGYVVKYLKRAVDTLKGLVRAYVSYYAALPARTRARDALE